MISEIFEDVQSLIKEPKRTFEKVLASQNKYDSKFYIAFSLLMSTYYVFLPSYLLIFNILALFIFFLLLGFTYYFVQEMAIVYTEIQEVEDDGNHLFYKLAYCFALASVPALCLNLLSNVLCLVLIKNIIVSLFIAALINIPICIIGIFYSQVALGVLSKGEYDLQNLIEISSRSLLTTLQENFGLRAMQEMIEDFRAAK